MKYREVQNFCKVSLTIPNFGCRFVVVLSFFGVIFIKEFCREKRVFEKFMVFQAEREKEYDAASFQEGFKVFDSDNSGSIAMAEMKNILTKLGEKLSEEEATAILSSVVDSDGKIAYEKLIKFVTTVN